MATKKVSDEQITAALLSHGTIKSAAQAVGVSERTIYDRMNDKDFQIVYKTAKTDLMRTAVHSMSEQLQAAIDTISEIMANKDAAPATRLQAAQAIINNVDRFTRRLQESETAAQAENNRLDFHIDW